MMPRQPKDISKKTEFQYRFATRLKKIMDAQGWKSRDVADLVKKAGLAIGDRAVDSWLGGRRLPKLKELEIVGMALGLADYRTELIPPPSRKPHSKSV